MSAPTTKPKIHWTEREWDLVFKEVARRRGALGRPATSPLPTAREVYEAQHLCLPEDRRRRLEGGMYNEGPRRRAWGVWLSADPRRAPAQRSIDFTPHSEARTAPSPFDVRESGRELMRELFAKAAAERAERRAEELRPEDALRAAEAWVLKLARQLGEEFGRGFREAAGSALPTSPPSARPDPADPAQGRNAQTPPEPPPPTPARKRLLIVGEVDGTKFGEWVARYPRLDMRRVGGDNPQRAKQYANSWRHEVLVLIHRVDHQISTLFPSGARANSWAEAEAWLRALNERPDSEYGIKYSFSQGLPAGEKAV